MLAPLNVPKSAACGFSRDPNLDLSAARLFELVTSLRSRGAEIRIQPVGFLQLLLPLDHEKYALKPSEGYRLHVWVPEGVLPRDRLEPVHDHVPDITSRVVCGAVKNFLFDVVDAEKGDFSVYSERIGERGLIRPSGREANLVVASEKIVSAGETYFVPRGVPHAAYALENFTITLIRRDNIAALGESRVFVSKKEGVGFSGRWEAPLDQMTAWDLVDFAFSRALGVRSPES